MPQSFSSPAAMVMAEFQSEDGASTELTGGDIAMAMEPIDHLLSDERLVDRAGNRLILLARAPSCTRF